MSTQMKINFVEAQVNRKEVTKCKMETVIE